MSRCNENRDTHILICPRELCNSVRRKVAILSDDKTYTSLQHFSFSSGEPHYMCRMSPSLSDNSGCLSWITYSHQWHQKELDTLQTSSPEATCIPATLLAWIPSPSYTPSLVIPLLLFLSLGFFFFFWLVFLLDVPHIFLFFGTPSEFLDVDHINDTLLCVWILLSKQNVDVCFGRQ